MSRIIKFRAWDKLDEMSFPDGCMTYFGVSDFIKGDYDVLMQYTGLNDKNGTEIYEGDIVKLTIINTNLYDYPHEHHDVGVIKFDCILYNGYIIETDTEIYDNICRSTIQYVEVIGNIYKNSELLEDK